MISKAISEYFKTNKKKWSGKVVFIAFIEFNGIFIV